MGEQEPTPELDRERRKAGKDIAASGISDSLRIEGVEMDPESARRIIEGQDKQERQNNNDGEPRPRNHDQP